MTFDVSMRSSADVLVSRTMNRSLIERGSSTPPKVQPPAFRVHHGDVARPGLEHHRTGDLDPPRVQAGRGEQAIGQNVHVGESARE